LRMDWRMEIYPGGRRPGCRFAHGAKVSNWHEAATVPGKVGRMTRSLYALIRAYKQEGMEVPAYLLKRAESPDERRIRTPAYRPPSRRLWYCVIYQVHQRSKCPHEVCKVQNV
jgi:hypothetical protein